MTKTKSKTTTTIDPAMVGQFVVRTMIDDRAHYLNVLEDGLTEVLNDAAEFVNDREAANRARTHYGAFPGRAASFEVCMVRADGTASMTSAVELPAPAKLQADDEIVDDEAVQDTPAAVQGELLPSDAGAAAPQPVVAGQLQLSSPGLAQMTAIALASHAADLKKLAKDARALGKTSQAQSFEKDAALITEDLLAQLEPQAKLPFGYADVTKALGDRISGKLRSQLVTAIKRDTPLIEGDTSGKERTAKIEQKIDDFELLVGNVAAIVTALVEPTITQAAEKGMLAGRLARETTAETLALEAVEAVSNG
jgi:hypothetical protein